MEIRNSRKERSTTYMTQQPVTISQARRESVAEMQSTFPITRSNGLKATVALQFACQCSLHTPPSSVPLPLEEVDLPSIAILAGAINACPQKDDTSHYHLTPLQIRAERCLSTACDWLTLSAICRDCSLICSVYRFHQAFDDGNKPLPTGKLN